MSEVEKELIKATGVKAIKGKREPFLNALHDAVQELDDDSWEKLSDGAQKWANRAASAVKKKKAIPDFEVAAVGDDKDEAESPPAKSTKKKAKAADKAPPKKAKAAAKDNKTKAKEVTKPSGVKVRIKELVIADPLISVEGIVEQLGKAGGEVSRVTVSNIRAEFRHSLKVLQEHGLLKGLSI